MFAPSQKTLICLCNALYVLPNWGNLLDQHGLANTAAEHAEMMIYGDAIMQAEEGSWNDLKAHLDCTREADSEQLRLMCSELLRSKDGKAAEAKDKTKFLDAMAQFEVALVEDGYTFNGFEVRQSSAIPSVVEDADRALTHALEDPGAAFGREASEAVSKAKKYLTDGEYDDRVTNLRLAMKHVLEGIAKDLAQGRGETVTFNKEDEVREYLRRSGFLTEEEKRGLSGIYGLLSIGPHGKADRSLALLGYAAFALACQYVIAKHQGSGP